MCQPVQVSTSLGGVAFFEKKSLVLKCAVVGDAWTLVPKALFLTPTVVETRVAESEVKCPTFPKFPNPTPLDLILNEVWMSTILEQQATNGSVLHSKNSFRIPNSDLRVRCKKWFSWTSGIGSSFLRSPIPTKTSGSLCATDSATLVKTCAAVTFSAACLCWCRCEEPTRFLRCNNSVASVAYHTCGFSHPALRHRHAVNTCLLNL